MRTALVPTNIGEAMQLSEMLSRSSMVPQVYRGKPQDIFVAVAWGAEVGLGPLQALNGVSVINGKPALWGDAAMALVRGHKDCLGIREGVEGDGDQMVGFCEVTRRGQPTERRTFSVGDAKKAGLWGKQGPWQQYPARMLQMRARGFAIRDVFPDALRGVITAEEAEDAPAVKEVPNTAPPEPGTPAATFAALQAPADEGLPMLSPDGELIEVQAKGLDPSITRWMGFCRRAVAKVAQDGSAALRQWAQAMEPHFHAIVATYPDEVEAIRQAITRALDGLAQAEGVEEPEAA
ncbi:MAG: hypothetical protein KGR68_15300 [Betaproteobacteria bacterium]|nr:hypothetical protein [Betaproteobacteria bacterium]